MNDISIDANAMLRTMGQAARDASAEMASCPTDSKNQALRAIAESIRDAEQAILAANSEDVDSARTRDLTPALLDRLELNSARVESMCAGLLSVATQQDPIGAMSETRKQPSGLEIARMRVPLGVIGVIYESRPNVTADAAGICIKAGNAVILRGGSEAIRSNRVIAKCVQSGLQAASLPKNAVQLVDTTDRAAVGAMLASDEFIDVIIPRGGRNLVARISEEARVPVIKHLDGICHVYLDDHCNADMAVSIAENAKTYRYGICGSMETLLIADSQAANLLPKLIAVFAPHNVELRGCERVRQLHPELAEATIDDWKTEYLGPILSIRVVDGIEQAINHINEYGSGHTDAIVTDHLGRARHFVQRVDSSSVMVNAATCFADGAEYGLGAEIGISTDKMHVRGPVGVVGLTTEKYVVTGDGTIRT